ncbi:ATP-binding protein [Iodidimonas gelatinilytica]|uniref:ATP-binding protein n=1 Tax=Iodidimonas gelatinilytica TaxID=1236966 RepID=UPI001B2FF7F0
MVDDEGPGLPHGAAERIFERFYSERPASEDFGTHSGLGLSISKQIVEAHHGTITAENRFPPLADEKEDAPKGRAKARPKGKGKAKAKTNAKAQKANPAPDPTPEQAAAAQDQPVLGARFQVYLPRW